MCLVRLISSSLLFVSLISYSVPALTFFDSHLPLSSAETQKRIPMRHLATLDPSKLISSLKVGARTVQLSTNSEEDLVLSGQADQGTWSVKLNNIYAMLPSELYQADLDGNGQQDLILLRPTAGNGLAPSQHLLVLSFDQQGQVTPWQVEGYFSTDKRGIVDFVDLNGNGRAELVYMSYGNGYWQTDLYEAHLGKWQQIQGKFAGQSYPLLTRFTHKPNHKIASKVKAVNPIDLSTTQALFEGYLQSYQWANVNQSEDISLLLKMAKSTVNCQPVSWYSLFMLVVDEPKQREIISLAVSPKTVQTALREVIDQHYPLSVYGQRATECSPEQVWAKAQP